MQSGSLVTPKGNLNTAYNRWIMQANGVISPLPTKGDICTVKDFFKDKYGTDGLTLEEYPLLDGIACWFTADDFDELMPPDSIAEQLLEESEYIEFEELESKR